MFHQARLFLLVVFVGLAVAPLRAADAPFYWAFINVVIDVQKNGDLLITETQKYVFTRQHTTDRFRRIPLERVDAVTDVQVSENGRRLRAHTGTTRDQFWIRWDHTLNPPESHTFLITYRVRGGLQIDDGGDQIFWKALFKDRSAPIVRGQVTVRLPTMLSGQVTRFQSFGSSATAQQIDERTILFTTQGSLPPGDELEVQVTFPHGVLAVSVPQWQKRRTYIPAWLVKIPAWLIVVVAIVIIVVVWRFFLDRKCPECDHHLAIEKTGKEVEESFPKRTLRERRCKYCDHRMWVVISSGWIIGGGGWGDGGGGGGGGGGG